MTMTAEQMFNVWAPDASLWSRWAKPVLFVNLSENILVNAAELWSNTDASWASSSGGTAVVVDLPGGQSVAMGIALAKRGFRPVPLYNSCNGPAPIVDLSELMDAIAEGTHELAQHTVHDEAPPAFLLDANRMTGTPLPARFDNRWMTFPQDFPSANFLLSKGIRRVLLVAQYNCAEDLTHVLLRWQEAGIELHLKTPRDGVARSLTVTTPPRYRSFWYRVLALIGLRRGSVGGFGAIVPAPGQSGGSGGYRGFG